MKVGEVSEIEWEVQRSLGGNEPTFLNTRKRMKHSQQRGDCCEFRVEE